MVRQRPVLLVVGAVACLGLSACDVEVDSPDPQGAEVKACRSFLAELPDSVADEDRRGVDGDFAAAYGDPAIVIRCGVTEAAASTSCVQIDGLDWAFDDTGNGVIATTYGRTPVIEVQIPAAYGGSSAALVDLGPAVLEATTSRRSCL